MNRSFKQMTIQDGSNVWFTSDTHFNHKNILAFCHRPFEDIKTHDEALIDNWNSCVSENDIIFHLGDFAFSSQQYALNIAKNRS